MNLCYKADNFGTAAQPGMIGKNSLGCDCMALQPSLGAGEKESILSSIQEEIQDCLNSVFHTGLSEPGNYWVCEGICYVPLWKRK